MTVGYGIKMPQRIDGHVLKALWGDQSMEELSHVPQDSEVTGGWVPTHPSSHPATHSPRNPLTSFL